MVCESDDPDKVADEMPKSDLCWSLCFSPAFIRRLFFSGFLSIAANVGGDEAPLWLLLPKLHLKRCIALFEGFHVSKKTLKISGRYQISINQDFDHVIERCSASHESSWLHPPLVAALKALKNSETVKAVSVELWSAHNELVAGEIGVVVGAVYTSLTGFSNRVQHSGSGKVQLAALAEILRSSGVAFWDFGMSLPYKLEMGAHEIHRKEFLKLFRAGRQGHLSMVFPDEKVSARSLIDALTGWQAKT